MRDLGRDDTQITATLAVIAAVSPDVLILTDFDYDYDQKALAAFSAKADYPYAFSTAPNAGVPTGLDLDGNGKLGEARDMQGYGRFTGDGGMAILSRYPIKVDQVSDLSQILWAKFPGATLPETLTAEAAEIQRLSSTGHWRVPINAPGGTLEVWMSSHTPPVFDGPEDRNGLRNRDELLLWKAVMDQSYGPIPETFLIAGNLNLDPQDGEGLREDLQAFLSDPRIQDATPTSAGGIAAASPGHLGDPGLDTADWSESGPGNLRVSYVLPAAIWQVTDAGVFWPAPGTPEAALLGSNGLAAGPHHLVWVDVRR